MNGALYFPTIRTKTITTPKGKPEDEKARRGFLCGDIIIIIILALAFHPTHPLILLRTGW